MRNILRSNIFLKASSVVAQRNLMALKEQKAWYEIVRRNPFEKAVWSDVALSFYLSTDNIMVGCMGAGSSYQMMFDATLTLKWALSRYIYIYWPPFHSTQILALCKSDSTQNLPFYKSIIIEHKLWVHTPKPIFQSYWMDAPKWRSLTCYTFDVFL